MILTSWNTPVLGCLFWCLLCMDSGSKSWLLLGKAHEERTSSGRAGIMKSRQRETWKISRVQQNTQRIIVTLYCMQISYLILNCVWYKHNQGISIPTYSLIHLYYLTSHTKWIQLLKVKNFQGVYIPKKIPKYTRFVPKTGTVYISRIPAGKCWKYNKHSAYLAFFWWWHFSYQ